jgi:hypothetical protein
MRVDTTSRPIDIGADSIKPGRPAHRVEREMLAANPIDHHARDRVDAVVSAAALRTPAMDEQRSSPATTPALLQSLTEASVSHSASETLAARPLRAFVAATGR